MPKFDFKKSLQKFVEKNPPQRETKDIERETDEIFLKYMEKYAEEKQKQDKTYLVVPKFFDRKMLIKEKNQL